MKNNFIPFVTDINEKGLERSYDVFSRLLRDRIIFLHGEINFESAALVCAQLLALEADNNKNISIFINSTGGIVEAGFSIIDIMDLVKKRGCEIHTIATGIAASAAALILCKGSVRFATSLCRIMIHQPFITGFQGQVTDLEIYTLESQNAYEKCSEIISKATGQDIKKVKKDLNRDKYMSADEAVSYGLIDSVI